MAISNKYMLAVPLSSGPVYWTWNSHRPCLSRKNTWKTMELLSWLCVCFPEVLSVHNPFWLQQTEDAQKVFASAQRAAKCRMCCRPGDRSSCAMAHCPVSATVTAPEPLWAPSWSSRFSAPPEVLAAQWAWVPLAAIVVPGHHFRTGLAQTHFWYFLAVVFTMCSKRETMILGKGSIWPKKQENKTFTTADCHSADVQFHQLVTEKHCSTLNVDGLEKIMFLLPHRNQL